MALSTGGAAIGPGGVNRPALTPVQQRAPITIRSATQPAKPATGGHYVNLGGNVWRQIHAVGPGKWAPGPPAAKPVTPARPTTPTSAKATTTTTNQYSTPLYQPLANQGVLSGKALNDYVTQLTNATYDPVINQYNQQIAQRTAQGQAAQSEAAGYSNALGQFVQNAAQKSQDIASGLNTTLQGIGSSQQSALSQIANQAAPVALQNLATQGLGGGATQSLADQIAGLRAKASTIDAANQAYGAKVGANAATYANTLPATYALAGQQEIGKIGQGTQAALAPMELNLTNEQAKKAAAFSTNLAAARQQQINNAVALGGLGIKQTAAQTAASTAAWNQNPNAKGSPAYGRAQTAASQAKTAANTAWNNDPNNVGSAAWARVQSANRAKQAAAVKAGKAAASTNKPVPVATQNAILKTVTDTQTRLRQLANQYQAWGYSQAQARSNAYHALLNGRMYVLAPTDVLDPKTGKAKIDPKTGQRQTQRVGSWQPIPGVAGGVGILNAANSTAYSDSPGLNAGDQAYLKTIGLDAHGKLPFQLPGPYGYQLGQWGQQVSSNLGY